MPRALGAEGRGGEPRRRAGGRVRLRPAGAGARRAGERRRGAGRRDRARRRRPRRRRPASPVRRAAAGSSPAARSVDPRSVRGAIAELERAVRDLGEIGADGYRAEAERELRRLGRRASRRADPARRGAGVADRARARARRPRQARPHEPPDRGGELSQRAHRRATPVAHLRQARRVQPGRGRVDRGRRGRALRPHQVVANAGGSAAGRRSSRTTGVANACGVVTAP